jgi:FtsZ-binding cell division protein ZapB
MEKNIYVTEDYEKGMANIREKIRTFKKQGKDVVYTAIFITGREKVKLVDRATTKQLALVGRNLKYENPDRVRIELYDGQESKNMLWVAEIPIGASEEKEEKPSFQGLGEAEISQIVDERFKQRQRNAEYEALQEKVSELSAENQEMQDELDELRNEKESLEKELEGKKNIRYYAGMLGDILESFGIAKDRIRLPLAGLMGINEENPRQAPQGSDRSGIVEDVSPEEEKRGEVIALITEYLHSASNQALINVFTIFSEIEKDEKTAATIINFLNTQKP